MRGGRGTERGRREGAAAAAAPDRPRAWTALPPGARAVAAFRPPCRPLARPSSGFASRPLPARLWPPAIRPRIPSHPLGATRPWQPADAGCRSPARPFAFMRRVPPPGAIVRRANHHRQPFSAAAHPLPPAPRVLPLANAPHAPLAVLVSEPHRAVPLLRGGGAALRARTRCAALWPRRPVSPPRSRSLRRGLRACAAASAIYAPGASLRPPFAAASPPAFPDSLSLLYLRSTTMASAPAAQLQKTGQRRSLPAIPTNEKIVPPMSASPTSSSAFVPAPMPAARSKSIISFCGRPRAWTSTCSS